jgi:hypothetical protein
MFMLAFIPSYCIITAALAQIFEAEELVKNFPLFRNHCHIHKYPIRI